MIWYWKVVNMHLQASAPWNNYWQGAHQRVRKYNALVFYDASHSFNESFYENRMRKKKNGISLPLIWYWKVVKCNCKLQHHEMIDRADLKGAHQRVKKYDVLSSIYKKNYSFMIYLIIWSIFYETRNLNWRKYRSISLPVMWYSAWWDDWWSKFVMFTCSKNQLIIQITSFWW